MTYFLVGEKRMLISTASTSHYSKHAIVSLELGTGQVEEVPTGKVPRGNFKLRAGERVGPSGAGGRYGRNARYEVASVTATEKTRQAIVTGPSDIVCDKSHSIPKVPTW